MVGSSDVRTGESMEPSRFKFVRFKLGYSQKDFASLLNQKLNRAYSIPKISAWETGGSPIPRIVASEVEVLSRSLPISARVVVFANQKGGVGKTTSVLNVGAGLALLGQAVLIIDADPQATATQALLLDRSSDYYDHSKTIVASLLGDLSLASITISSVSSTSFRGSLDLVPSHINLAEIDSRREPGVEVLLKEKISDIASAYDYILIDAPPNLGLLTWMALTAADEVVIPVRTEPYDTLGVGQILSTISKIQRRLNPALTITGVLPTQYDRRKVVDREVLSHLIATLGDRVPILSPIPLSAAFGHSARAGTITSVDSETNVGGAAYRQLSGAIALRQQFELASVEE
jgi:chromosome partitioning protein